MDRTARLLSWAAAVWLIHLSVTLLATKARIGLYVFTLPLVTPIAGAESIVGGALWLFLLDLGAVSAVGALWAFMRAPEDEREKGGQALEPITPLSRLSARGHVVAALLLAGLLALLLLRRDEVFVFGLVAPTPGGVFGVMVRPMFGPGFSAAAPWILIGGLIDVARHLVFAGTGDRRVRLVARLLARAATAMVLAYVALVGVLNVAEPALPAETQSAIARMATWGLVALALVAAGLGVRDWVTLAREATAPRAGASDEGGHA